MALLSRPPLALSLLYALANHHLGLCNEALKSRRVANLRSEEGELQVVVCLHLSPSSSIYRHLEVVSREHLREIFPNRLKIGTCGGWRQEGPLEIWPNPWVS